MSDFEIKARAFSLFDAIKHGNADHQRWLKDAIEAHFQGKPVPPVLGLLTPNEERTKLKRQLAEACARVAAMEKVVEAAYDAVTDGKISALARALAALPPPPKEDKP